MLEFLLFMYVVVAALWLAFSFIEYCDAVFYEEVKNDRIFFARMIVGTPVWPIIVLALCGRPIGKAVGDFFIDLTGRKDNE